jgi:S1-C subfamily serine protease
MRKGRGKGVASAAAAIAFLCVHTPHSDAFAQLERATVGAWTVRSVTDNGSFHHCVMTSASSGPHLLLFAVARSVFSLGISGYRWDVPERTPIHGYYAIDGGSRISVSGVVERGNLMLLNLRPPRQAFDAFRTASSVRLVLTTSREHTFTYSISWSAAAFDRLLSCANTGLRMAMQTPAPSPEGQPGPALGHNAPRARPAQRPQERPAAAPPSAPPKQPSPPPAKPPEREAASTDSTGQKLISAATGFYISPAGHLLTAAHVVKDCKTLRAQVIGDAPAAAIVIAKSEADDLALLKADRKPPAVAPVRIGSLRLGEQIVQFGFPLATSLASSGNLTTGNIAALAGPRDDHRMIQISAPSQPGNSGGPVLDLQGRVVGVLVSGLGMRYARATGTLPQNINFAVKSSVTVSFLEAHGLSVEAGGVAQDMSVADVAEHARRFTARIDCFE